MNQHYVPKLLLDGFVNEQEAGNRGLWVYRASTQRWLKRPTRRVASIEDLYNFVSPDEPRDDTVEESMSNIESGFATILRETIALKRPIAPPRPFDIVVTFCGLLICRNPAAAARVGDSLVREAKQHMSSVIATDEAFQEFRAELRDRAGIDFPNVVPADRPRLLTDFAINATKLGSLGMALLGLNVLSEQLSGMTISFYHTSHRNPFITADVPYAILSAVNDANEVQIEQLVIPLSATVAAVFDTGDSPIYRHRDASEAHVRQINAAILSGAEDILISYRADVIPPALLSRWSTSDAGNRVLIARELGA